MGKLAVAYFGLCFLAGAEAHAAEDCMPWKKVLAMPGVTVLTAGQANFSAGIYAATPPVGPAPKHDGAALAEFKDGSGIVLWTHGSPKPVTGCVGFLVSRKFLELIKGVATAKDEETL